MPTETLPTVAVSSPGVDLSQATSDFNQAADAYQQAKVDLAAAYSAAESVQAATDAAQLADTSTWQTPRSIDVLNDVLENIQIRTDDVPVMASDAPVIEGQASMLRITTDGIRADIKILDDAINAIHDNQIAWARNVLNAAISYANSAQSTPSGLPGNDLIVAQQNRLAAAQQMLDGLDDAEPGSVGPEAAEAALALVVAHESFMVSSSGSCGGVEMPGTVAATVCGGVPNNVVKLPLVKFASYYSEQIFQTPSGNIGCSLAGGNAQCTINRHSWALPPVMSAVCSMGVMDGDCRYAGFWFESGGVQLVAPSGQQGWETAKGDRLAIPTLSYGKSIQKGSVVCSSASSGVTCWNIKTHHGYKMSADQFLYW